LNYTNNNVNKILQILFGFEVQKIIKIHLLILQLEYKDEVLTFSGGGGWGWGWGWGGGDIFTPCTLSKGRILVVIRKITCWTGHFMLLLSDALSLL
jgi:hypothetical protein